jgi:enoyl-CoA hydratase/carnithine racemase
MTARIEISRDGHTQIVSLSADNGRPALDKTAYTHLTEILDEAAANADLRCVVLRGLDGCFCSGADLNEFTEPHLYPSLIAAVTGYFRALASFPKPLFACVEGEATGVGCTTLFHCDLIFASPHSSFRVPFVDFGLVPDAATSILAPIRLGYAAAFRFFCLGEQLDAQGARDIGLVTDLCTERSPMEEALDVAKRAARKPAHAMETARRLLRFDVDQLYKQIDCEIELFRDALDDDATRRRLRRLARMAA